MLRPIAELTLMKRRIGRTIYIDERVVDAFDKRAMAEGVSTNRLIESLGFALCKIWGAIPRDAEPIGETRGGDRRR